MAANAASTPSESVSSSVWPLDVSEGGGELALSASSSESHAPSACVHRVHSTQFSPHRQTNNQTTSCGVRLLHTLPRAPVHVHVTG